MNVTLVQFQPQRMLLGHAAPITAIATCDTQPSPVIVVVDKQGCVVTSHEDTPHRITSQQRHVDVDGPR